MELKMSIRLDARDSFIFADHKATERVDPHNPNTDDGLLLPAVQDDGLLLPAVQDDGLLLPAVQDDGLLLPAVQTADGLLLPY
jgi:hypothetical protein